MSRNDRIKRRLLGQAVRENVEVIHGLTPGLRRGRRWALVLRRTVVLGLVPLGFLASSFVIWPLARENFEPIPVASVPSPVGVASSKSQPTVEESLAKLRFDRPPALDRNVLPLGLRRVVLDPGHGGANSGTVTPQGLQEKNLTLDIGHRLRRLLEDASFEVSMTRRADEAVSLEDRVALANAAEGDIFVSIHVNWIETQNVRGVETYYLGPTDDPYLNKLASAENRNSGYSLGDFRRLLEGIYVDVREDESRQLAESVQSALFRSLRVVNRQLQNRGMKTAPFVVLIGTEMPAILAEVSCLSNEREAGLLQKPRYRQYIADALFTGIRSYADSLNHSIAPDPADSTGLVEPVAQEGG